MKKQKTQKNKKGFTLLFAVLVSTLVLAVGASIISMALRQVILSGIGRDSQFAFYAANTGIECALYWDLNSAVTFATSSSATNMDLLDCAGEIVDKQASDNQSSFRINMINIGDNNEIRDVDLSYCVDVTVTKSLDTSGSQTRIRTDILSRGYNTCDTNNTRRIERGLELSY